MVSGITRTLTSVSALFTDGMNVVFTESGCSVYGRLLFCGSVNAGVYEVQPDDDRRDQSKQPTALSITTRGHKQINGLEHWHQRLGHLNYNAIVEMEKSGKVEGMKIDGPRSLDDKCEACALSKVLEQHPRTPNLQRTVSVTPI